MTSGDETSAFVASYGQQAAKLHDAAGMAQLQVDIWQGVDKALRGVIGPLGVAALLARSLQLAARQHPALAAACVPSAAHTGGQDLAALRSALQHMPMADAQAAAHTLLQVYDDLLTSLIGGALAQRLLQPVWHTGAGHSPHKDTSA